MTDDMQQNRRDSYHSKPGDPRLGDLLTEGIHGDIVFVLYPCDIGVERNGGRVGARLAPARFLHFLRRMGSVHNPEYNVDLSNLTLSYCNVDLDGIMGAEDALHEAHCRLTDTVTAVLHAGGVPFCVGGGNDQSYANWRALRHFLANETNHPPKVGIINIDAHLDVRPVDSTNKPSSGTPFRQVLNEADGSVALVAFAAQGSQCSKEHADYVTSNGGSIKWLKEMREDATTEFQTILKHHKRSGVNTFVSFDLDAIKACDCPGVSCPANTGLAAEDALGIMKVAGEAETVRMVDMSEMNPVVEDFITPRLATQMAYHFLIGFCLRRRQEPKPYRLRISNLSQLVCVDDVQQQGFRTGEHMANIHIIQDGSILVDQKGKIAYAGPAEGAPNIDSSLVDEELDGRGKSAIPGLCDAHTHPVWAGDRVHEFALKLAGASYMDIHKIGGGINFTVNHTRQADEETLYRSLVDRLDRMNATGTTLVEAKSGYGLDTETELKMLRVIDRAQQDLSFVDLVGNFCGAHSIPQGVTEEQAVDIVVNKMIPALAKEQMEGRLSSIKLVDVFADAGVFSTKSARRILDAGAHIGLLGNFHGDELTYQACGELAGKLKCRAVSHLEHVSEDGIAAMKESHTAAVLLPTTSFVLRLAPPPSRKLITRQVPVALGTDFNPNAHCSSMLHAMNLACVMMEMTVEEALVASTLNAAYSMGMQETHGSLQVGKQGDIVVVNEARWEHVIYQFGGAPPLYAVIKDGVPRILS